MRGAPVSARLLVIVMTALGGALLVWTVASASWSWVRVVCLGAAVGIDFFRVDLRRYLSKHKVTITMDMVTVFVMMGLFGPAWAMLTLLLNTVVYAITERVPVYKVAYNLGVLSLGAWLAGQVLFAAPGHWLLVLPLAAGLYFLTNTAFVALIIGLLSDRSPLTVWLENYRWVFLQQITLAVSGFVLGKVTGTVGWWVLLGALPIPMLHYTYQLYAKADEQHIKDSEAMSIELITTLASVVDARDAYTFGHSTHVARYSVAIAKQMGYSQDALDRLYRSALLHDIGKVGIPEHVLFKPGRLTDEEYELMKRHTTVGYEIIRQIRSMQDAAWVARQHHERWSGGGYPDGIPSSRIVAVADALETMLSDRPYRKGCTLEDALTEVRRCAGEQFDPSVVDALLAVVTEKGKGYFVNSAELINKAGRTPMHWTPVDLTQAVAAARK